MAGREEVIIMSKRLIYALIGALLIAGCGDSDSNKGPKVVPPPVTSDIVTVGTISGFGSVISQGIEFNTDSATVTMDGEPGILSDLRIGMIVSIRGTRNDETGAAVASQIYFSDDAEGVITNLNAANDSFVVLGRTVLVDALTVFDNATFESLAAGNVVQVSGQWRSQERIQATHVERIANAYAAGMKMEVKGEINGLDIGTQHFNIGTQSCDYSAAMLELGGADLANGLYVEVSSTSALSNGDLILDRIQARDRDRDKDQLCDSGCDFELDGYVTAFVSATEFEVDGSPVSTTAETVYVNGTVDTLALDVKLAVDGTLDDAGVLIADRIVFHLPSIIEIEADLESVDANSAAVTVLGIVVTTNDSTMFRDDSDAVVLEFGLDDLAIGDRVEVRAYIDSNTVVATRLERDDPDDSVTLRALVEAVAQPNLTLLGVTVTSDQDTVFQNVAQEIIDADEFFTLVDIDSLVKAEGTYDGTSILADKLFLRECEKNCM
jgi:hypothetical protein